jgi:phenylacetate-CoA ligase
VSDGQQGWIVGTSLWNTAMPMIRYRTSDVSAIVPGSCKCGRAHRRIRSVTTKAEDVVVTPDGRVISASVLTHPFKPLDGLRKSQIIQETVNHVVVKIVPAASLSDADRQQLLDGLQTRLGPDVRIEIVVVDDIPPERSGKYRWVISKVPHRSNMPWEQQS